MRPALAAAIGAEEVVAARLLPVATALVERYAPGAPAPVQDEAVIRCSAGYLIEQPAGSIRAEQEGAVSTEYATASLSALRHSGAAGLLTPWKVRRTSKAPAA